MKDWHDDESPSDGDASLKGKVFHEFECPKCDAHNPSDGFKLGEEIFCFYCGATFKPYERDGRVKLKEV